MRSVRTMRSVRGGALRHDTKLRQTLRRNLAGVAGLVLLALVAALAAALATWSIHDPSWSHATEGPVRNALGAPGAIVADLLMQFIGLASAVFLAPVAVWGWQLMTGRLPRVPRRRLLAWIGGTALACGFAAALAVPGSWPLPTGLGGVIGDAVLEVPLMFGGSTAGLGRWIVAVVLGLPCALLLAYAAGLLGRAKAKDEDASEEDAAEPAASERPARLAAVTGYGLHLALSGIAAGRRIAGRFRREPPEPAYAGEFEPDVEPAFEPPLLEAPRRRRFPAMREVTRLFRDPEPGLDEAHDIPVRREPSLREPTFREAEPRFRRQPERVPVEAYDAEEEEAPYAEEPRAPTRPLGPPPEPDEEELDPETIAAMLAPNRTLGETKRRPSRGPAAKLPTERANERSMELAAASIRAATERAAARRAALAAERARAHAQEDDDPYAPLPAAGYEDEASDADLPPWDPAQASAEEDYGEEAYFDEEPAPLPPPARREARPAPAPAARPAPARGAAAPPRALSRMAVTPVRSDGRYVMPPLPLLAEPKIVPGARLSGDALERNAGLLEGVLEDFSIRGEIIDARPGPVVTLYELEPAPGVKSSRVIGLADDIARSMSAIAARVAVIPGKNAIGIELPNQKRETVYLRELLASQDFAHSKGRLALALGKTIGGEAVIADLARMPHLLVAGTTGSGKSVSINTMILSLLYRLTPAECRLIMIDPKMLELSVYDGIPHLLTPVVTDPKKAVVALKWTVREMEDRYKKMSKVGVRNIDGFNARVAQAKAKGEVITRTVQTGFDRETGEAVFETEEMDLDPIPYIVVIVDEMADLMMVAGKEIEGAIQRLAQMARAAGIHIVMATQRPSVDVITGTIKANFPTRISFQVTSKIDSRTILGEQGAEQLLGQGDMLFMAGGGRVQRVHGPFVSDDEVEKVVQHLKAQGAPDYLDSITEESEDGPGGGDDSGPAPSIGDDDAADLYDKAVAIVLRDKKASTSYVQRRLGIGYNRAASIIERMEKEGVVGPANHAGKREILVPGGPDSEDY